MKIVVTDHARVRFKERWLVGGEIQEVTERAWKEGRGLNNSLQRTVLNLGYHLPNYWTAIHKVYYKMVFVFQRDYDGQNRATLVLITIVPLRYLMKRRQEMIQRYYAQRNQKMPKLRARACPRKRVQVVPKRH